MNLPDLIEQVQLILRDDSDDLPSPPKEDSLEVPEEFRDILVMTAAAKFMEKQA